MTKQTVAQTVDEIADLFSQIQYAEANAAKAHGPYGSDLSVLIDKLKAKLAELGIGNLASEGIHMALHFAIETLLPKISETAPFWAKIGIDHFIIPLLKKLDEKYHPTT